MPWYKSEYAARRDKEGKLRGNGNKLLSASYKEFLGALVNEKDRLELKLPEGATWADAIGQQVVRRSVGLVSKENICFTAITELREVTEGKIAAQVAIGAGNPELLALAAAIGGDPAPEPGVPVDNEAD